MWLFIAILINIVDHVKSICSANDGIERKPLAIRSNDLLAGFFNYSMFVRILLEVI